VNRVAAEVPQEVGVLLQDEDVDAGAGEEQPSIIPAGPPPATQQRVEIVSATMSVLGVEVSTRAGSSVKPSVVRGRGSDGSGAGSGRRARFEP